MSSQEAAKAEFVSAGFDTLNLSVGARLLLLPTAEPHPPQWSSQLIGYLKDQFLIVRHPQVDGLSVRLAAGQWLCVRTFTGTHIAEFEAGIERLFVAPLSYLHLSYPSEVRTVLLRRDPRLRVDLPARVKSGDSGAADDVRIVDLSVNGVRLQFNGSAPPEATQLSLEFSLPGEPEQAPITLSVSARSTASKAASARAGNAPRQCSARFETLDVPSRLAIQSFIYHELFSNPQAIAS